MDGGTAGARGDAAARMSNVRTRVDGIDVLRGLAIFFVLMNHVNMRLFLAKVPYTREIPAQLVNTLVWNGQYGVQIFFAVSGFLITSTSLRRWGSLAQVSLRDFYVFRFARIAPLLLLLLAVLSALHIAGLKDYIVAAETGGLGRALLAALTFHVNVLEAQRGYLPGNWDILWSLSVEEMFYLVFPLLCRVLGDSKGLIALLLAIVFTGPFARTLFSHGNEVWQEYSYLGGMDAIALGCLTALAIQGRQAPRRPPQWFGVFGTALLVLVLCCKDQMRALGLVHSGLDMTLCAVGTCMVISAAARSAWCSPGFLLPITYLGERSYEIYLTHMFVVFALFDLFVAVKSPLRSVPALFTGVILIAGVFGGWVARFYSEPMNRYLRRRWSNAVR